MNYDDAVAAFFAPRPEGTPLPDAVVGGSPARRLRDACEPVAMHAVWSRSTNEHLAGLGLDFLTSYVWGRAAHLGEPVGAVVASSFAWFEPGLVTTLYDDAVSEVADLLADAAEPADGTGRPFFSGVRAAGRPADPVHRLWWACTLVREHRGDSHVAAANASGLGPVEMNVLTELWIGMPLLSYTGTRGWPEDAMHTAVRSLEARGWLADGQLTASGLRVRSHLEARTDGQEQSIVDALGARLDEVCTRLDAWGAACVEAGSFPPDTLKRAAG
jgi:hypothetical protein